MPRVFDFVSPGVEIREVDQSQVTRPQEEDGLPVVGIPLFQLMLLMLHKHGWPLKHRLLLLSVCWVKIPQIKPLAM